MTGKLSVLSYANIWSLDYFPSVHAATVSRYLILTEISQPEGKWILPETRFTEFPALSVGHIKAHINKRVEYSTL